MNWHSRHERENFDHAHDLRKHEGERTMSDRANTTHFWCTSCGRINLEMTKEQARSASHSGSCDDDVLALSREPSIASQLADIEQYTLAGALKEYYEDAVALRRISMTLHRWHELECGDGNSYGSWAIVRGNKVRKKLEGSPTWETTFVHDDDGKPFIEHHHYLHGRGKDYVSYTALADRERGALKRLDKIMDRYPGFVSYVQGDPRGCALYILRPGDIATLADGANGDVGSIYTRGIAVYK